ncbi:MAG: serine hydrolase, partial [Bacteroidota bacterium]
PDIVSAKFQCETMSGAGSLKSSVMDMTKFIQKNFENDDVYNLPQDATFDSGKNESTGLGWIILEEDGFLIHFHDGGTGGFSSVLMIDKSKKIGVILLSNVEDYHGTTYSICRDLMSEICN